MVRLIFQIGKLRLGFAEAPLEAGPGPGDGMLLAESRAAPLPLSWGRLSVAGGTHAGKGWL